MKKSLLIFDFDGTIADTPAVAVQIYNEMSGDLGLPEVSRAEFMDYKRRSIRELMKLAGLPWFRLPGIIRKARRGFKKYLLEVPPVAGIPEVLAALQARGYRMGILTSNSRENVEAFLAHHQLQYFEFIHAPSSLFGKARVLAKIMKRGNLPPEALIMIGDELRDIEAAREVSVDSVAVTWGFNTEELLGSAGPSHIARQPAQLLDLFA